MSKNIQNVILVVVFLVGVFCCFGDVGSARTLAQEPIVTIDYYYEAGCSECAKIEKHILPQLKANYYGRYNLLEHDLNVDSNVLMLFSLEDRLGVTNKKTLTVMYLDEKIGFYGFNEMVEKGLVARVGELLDKMRGSEGFHDETPVGEVLSAEELVRSRLQRFTVPMVAFAGLLDGLNPCAISTLVFFMSLLGVSRVRGRQLILMGTSFCLASFCTYICIGFGLLHVLHTFSGFQRIKLAVEVMMIGVLIILSVVSFRDALRFRRNHDPKGVSLQLPDKIKMLIRKFMRKGLNWKHMIISGVMLGVGVTALETVCTGQVYFPTLVLVIKNGYSLSRSWAMLLAYNIMFVLPLIIAFIVTYHGIKAQALVRFSKNNVVPSKIVLGMFFLAMAIMIIFLQ